MERYNIAQKKIKGGLWLHVTVMKGMSHVRDVDWVGPYMDSDESDRDRKNILADLPPLNQKKKRGIPAFEPIASDKGTPITIPNHYIPVISDQVVTREDYLQQEEQEWREELKLDVMSELKAGIGGVDLDLEARANAVGLTAGRLWNKPAVRHGEVIETDELMTDLQKRYCTHHQEVAAALNPEKRKK